MILDQKLLCMYQVPGHVNSGKYHYLTLWSNLATPVKYYRCCDNCMFLHLHRCYWHLIYNKMIAYGVNYCIIGITLHGKYLCTHVWKKIAWLAKWSAATSVVVVIVFDFVVLFFIEMSSRWVVRVQKKIRRTWFREITSDDTFTILFFLGNYF